MSIVDHGRASFACVCRWSIGLRSSSRPWIHIFAGENVCIHVITPRQPSSPLASSRARRIAADVVSTGFHTSDTSGPRAAPRRSTIPRDCTSTWASVSGPYRSWLPVRNQTSPVTAGGPPARLSGSPFIQISPQWSGAARWPYSCW